MSFRETAGIVTGTAKALTHIGSPVKRIYKSRNRSFGVINYEIPDPSTIILQFKTGKFRYVYNSATPGHVHVTKMAELARAGVGLSTYVNQRVRENYAAKLPL